MYEATVSIYGIYETAAEDQAPALRREVSGQQTPQINLRPFILSHLNRPKPTWEQVAMEWYLLDCD
jgi:hypothetical protein